MMRQGLRNEDYVAFMDESAGGSQDLTVVAGVLIPARWLRGAERRWRDFIQTELGPKAGLKEIKSYQLYSGKGASYAAHLQLKARGERPLSAKAAGQQLMRRSLEHTALIKEVRVLSVGLSTRYPIEVYRLWFWLMYALLTEREKAPRPKLPLVVIDGEDMALRRAQDLVAHRFYKKFWNRRAYIKRGRSWFVGGSVHQKSHLHPFIEIADLVAGTARRSITRHPKFESYYRDHLLGPAEEKGHEIDLGPHALACLRKLDPPDRCGSGRSGILLPG